MLVIRREQLSMLGLRSFEDYVTRITDELSGERFSAAGLRRFPTGYSREDLTSFIRKAIARAQSFGFGREGDITPFIAMEFVLDEVFKNTGHYPWIEAIIKATDLDAEERMDAIYALMPERERTLCFDQWG